MSAVTVFSKLDKSKKVFDIIEYWVEQIAKAFLVGTIFVTCWKVAGRYVPGVPGPAWTEEIILMFMSYMAMLAAALALRRGAHVRMVILDPVLPKKVIKVLDLLVDVGVTFFCYILITVGWTYTMAIGAVGSFITMPDVSLVWRFLPIPLGGFFMLLFNIELIYKHIKVFFVEDINEEIADSSKADSNEADSSEVDSGEANSRSDKIDDIGNKEDDFKGDSINGSEENVKEGNSNGL